MTLPRPLRAVLAAAALLAATLARAGEPALDTNRPSLSAGSEARDAGPGWTCGADMADTGPGLLEAWTPSPEVFGPGGCPGDDGSVVDLLVVYTSAAAAGAGGTAAIESQITDAVSETNVAFANSLIPVTINCVGMEEVAYTESGSSYTNLLRVTTPGDGYLDEVPALRDELRADLVSFITEGGDVCGIAWYGILPGPTPRPDRGYNVVNRLCLGGGSYVFAHELGHNFGCLHDRAQQPCHDAGYEYSKGYVNGAGTLSTIMAPGSAEVSIQHFSNPDVLLDGEPTGVPIGDPEAAHNAATIALTAPLVAAFRTNDCNGNGLCDDVEIGQGSPDCNGNGIPDECEDDCDGDGIPDACAIAAGATDVNGNGVPDACEPSVLYVHPDATGTGSGTSWADAFTDLQPALLRARRSLGAVEEIWVAAGVYTPGSSPARALSFELMSGVALYGGFAGGETERNERDIDANATILSGDLDGDDGPGFANRADNSAKVVYASHVDETAVLDGFTVRGGSGLSGSYTCWAYGRGGGVQILQGRATLRNCTFIDNEATVGGAVAYYGDNATIESCTFEANRAPGTDGTGGAMYIGLESVVVNSVFRDNATDGAGGAVINIVNSGAYVNCLFAGNQAATRGGAVRNSGLGGSPVNMIGCVVVGNTAGSSGGGIDDGISDAFYTNCTIVGNSTTYYTGGLSGVDYTLSNCVVWGNVDNGFLPERTQLWGGDVAITNCLIEGWTGQLPATGTSDADPLFADADGADDVYGTGDDDVSLLPGSPAIDAGATALLPADAWDLDGDGDVTEALPLDLAGNPRLGGCIVDLGALEAPAAGASCCPTDVTGPEGAADGNVDALDFLLLISQWGSPCVGPCEADVTGAVPLVADGNVDSLDFLLLISQWGSPGNCGP
jgi:hypothetical protein